MTSSRFRLIIGLLSVLCLAVITHILVIFTLPGNVIHTPYTNLEPFDADGIFRLLPDIAAGAEPLPGLDPAMKHSVCRFHLEDGPVLVTAAVPSPFWSVGLFNETGEAIYSLNNRTAGSDILSMLVLTRQQLAILRENPPQELEDLIVIETEDMDGFALLRAYVPREASSADINAALESAYCGDL